MNSQSIRFAFAVNSRNAFEPLNFCNAARFLIYELVNNELILLKDEANHFKNADEKNVNDSEKNVKEIIFFLKSLGIDVLVSKKFGINIQMVNSFFIPVIVSSETTEEVKLAINKHIKWLENELKKRPDEYKLFTIKNGIMKTDINSTLNSPDA